MNSKNFNAAEYHKYRVRRIVMDLPYKTDEDIINKLESVKNISKYIKDLIRSDIDKEKEDI